MFERSARYYDAIYGFKDYREASYKLIRLIEEKCPHARTLLDVACGTGRHLEHLMHRYSCEGLDLNEKLLETARARCPGVPFNVGNMINFSLDGRFDVITLLFSSIAYARTPENLAGTMRSLARHLAPGGVIFVEPWFKPDNFWTGTITANHVDEERLKICWMYTSDPPVNNIAELNMKFMVGTPTGIEVFEEVHALGLFSDADWARAFRAASLVFEYEKAGLFNRGMYIARRAVG